MVVFFYNRSMHFVRFLTFLLVTAFVAVCLTNCHTTTQAPELPEGFVPLPRLDSILITPNGVEKVTQGYPEFASLWGQLLGQMPNQAPETILTQFASDSLICRLQDSINHTFPASARPDVALWCAFSRAHELAPSHPMPRLYYYNSGFQASVLVADSLLAIGLDRFLGRDSRFYQALAMPRYLAERMTPQYIVPTALEGWLSAEFPQNDPRPSVLDQMLYQGKIKYAITTLLPDLPDSVALQYTSQQLDWLEESEADIWTYLSEKKLLYEKNQLIVSQLTRPAPFTNAFGQKSPGQAVNWLGFRIVASYMRHHADLNLEDLFAPTLSNEQLLQNAKYRP